MGFSLGVGGRILVRGGDSGDRVGLGVCRIFFGYIFSLISVRIWGRGGMRREGVCRGGGSIGFFLVKI